MPHRATPDGMARVLIVDNDEETRLSLLKLFQRSNISATSLETGTDLFRSADLTSPGCLLLATDLEDMSGLDIQRRLAAEECSLPIVFITGDATIPMAVEAMKRGAHDFLLKPLDADIVVDAVHSALQRDSAARAHLAERDLARRLIETLTRREREVMKFVAAGDLNKQIAHHLDVSEMMVKIHRSRMMKKMGANSVVQLIKKLDLVYGKSIFR